MKVSERLGALVRASRSLSRARSAGELVAAVESEASGLVGGACAARLYADGDVPPEVAGAASTRARGDALAPALAALPSELRLRVAPDATALMAVPVVTAAGPRGLVVVSRRGDDAPFARVDQRVTEALAAYAAAVMEPSPAPGDAGSDDIELLLRAEEILDAAPDAMVVIDASGTIRLVNAQTEALFGYRREELVGEPIETLVPERFRVVHPAHRAAYVAAPRTRPMGAGLDLFARRKDGSEFAAEISLSPNRSPLGTTVTAAIRDVTERRRDLEEQNRRMHEANRLKSEFLANMSHELRTPLNAIIGFAALMHGGKAGPIDETHREYLGDILSSSRHLLQLINDVLDLAKVESGRVEIHPEPVEIARLVGEVRDIVRGLLAEKRLRLTVEVSPEVSTAVVDPRLLKQVLYNYLSNAIKFTPEGGAVGVRVSPETDECFRVDVTDTGIGIKREDLGRLFVEFQQLDAGTAKRYPGTGLGLALTRRIADVQGGRVEVTSDYGAGSTFSVVLPREVQSSEGPGEEEPR